MTSRASDPAWADVVPIPQDDGPSPPVAIAYSAIYAETMSYLRAVMASDERSVRVIALAGDAVSLNPSHYTAWHVRRLSLEATCGDLADELRWLARLVAAKSCWKNYQVWHHRRWLVERSGDAAAEGAFTAAALAEDAKNYHAWSHRQFVVRSLTGGSSAGSGASAMREDACGPWAHEAAFAALLLRDDVRNNSAWTHRWFALTAGGGTPAAAANTAAANTVAAAVTAPSIAGVSGLDALATIVRKEVSFTLQALRPVSRNEAAWAHLRACVLLGAILSNRLRATGAGVEGVAPRHEEGMDLLRYDCGGWGAWPEVLSFARHRAGVVSEEEGGGDAQPPPCRPVVFALEVLAEHAEASGDGGTASRLYDACALEEPVRVSYWGGRRDAASARRS